MLSKFCVNFKKFRIGFRYNIWESSSSSFGFGFHREYLELKLDTKYKSCFMQLILIAYKFFFHLSFNWIYNSMNFISHGNYVYLS